MSHQGWRILGVSPLCLNFHLNDVMFTRQIQLVSIFILLFAGASIVRGNSQELIQPVLSASEIYAIAEEYSKTITSKSSREYKLAYLSFDFVNGRWVVSYVCTAEKFPPGCHYGLIISNALKPEIEHMPGK